LLDEGRYGVIVPAESPESLAAAIDQHLRDPCPLQRLAALGPDRARAYDWTTIAARHVAWLRDVSGHTADLPGT
jgi:glycosyltransferase involved in cell wall biosynthesis